MSNCTLLGGMLRFPLERTVFLLKFACVLGAPAAPQGLPGNLLTGPGNRDFKCCAMGRGLCILSRVAAGRVCSGSRAEASHRSGCFTREERLLAIGFYLQVKGMMHPILNHCFSPGKTVLNVCVYAHR